MGQRQHNTEYWGWNQRPSQGSGMWQVSPFAPIRSQDLPFLNVFYGLFPIWICEINQIWGIFFSRLMSFVSIQSKSVCSCSIRQQFSFHFLVLHSVVPSKVSKTNATTVVKQFDRWNTVTQLPVALHELHEISGWLQEKAHKWLDTALYHLSGSHDAL